MVPGQDPGYIIISFHRNPENCQIRVGGYDISLPAQEDVPGAEDAQVENIIVHPNYRPGQFNYDIALVKLKKPITRTVQKVCLPQGRGQHLGVKLVHLTGWGLTVEGTLSLRY